MSRILKAMVSQHLTRDELKLLVGSYDVIGDVAMIIVPDSLKHREQQIAEAILQSNRKIKVVAKRVGQYSGEFRTIDLQVIAGEPRTETEVKEFGVRVRLDPAKVYFSIRSGNERKRIASLVRESENVLVLFSGVGPFPLIISKYSQAKCIVGIEKNPLAHGYALDNLKINKNLKNIHFHLGDVRDVLQGLQTCFDRILLVLPTGGEEFLPIALNALKPDGCVHFYDMQHRDRVRDSIDKVVAAAGRQCRQVVKAQVTKCGHCAPRTYRVCVDACID